MTNEKKILFADDDLRNRKLMETLLRIDGYRVLAVESGQALLDEVDQEMPDLIMLDLMMPGMDGFEVLRRLKASERTRNIPIVMVTALDDEGSSLRLRAAGVADTLSKPVDRWQLKKTLDQLLGAVP